MYDYIIENNNAALTGEVFRQNVLHISSFWIDTMLASRNCKNIKNK